MSDEVIKILEYLFSKFGIVVDWSNETMIPYIEELAQKFIQWKLSVSILWLIIGIVIVLPSIVLYIYAFCMRNNIHSIWNDWDFQVTLIIIGGIFITIGIIIIIFQTTNIITCSTFPEKALFDYASRLMRQR